MNRPQPTVPKKLNILLVEDDPKISELVQDNVLEEIPQASITPAFSVDAAIAAIDAVDNHWTLVILDMGLPMKWGGLGLPDNGLRVLNHIRRTNSELPIIIFSGIDIGKVRHHLDQYTHYNNKKVPELIQQIKTAFDLVQLADDLHAAAAKSDHELSQ